MTDIDFNEKNGQIIMHIKRTYFQLIHIHLKKGKN